MNAPWAARAPGAAILPWLGVLVLALALFAATWLSDHDRAAVATGRWILAHGALPRRDPFSYVVSAPFRAPAPLAALVAALAAHGGDTGPLALATLVGAGAALVVLGVAARSVTGRLALVPFLVAFVLAHRAGPFGLGAAFREAGFAGTILVALRLESGKPLPAYVPFLLSAFWLNADASALLGAPLLAVVAAVLAMPPASRPGAARAFARASAWSALGWLVSPHGTALPLELLRRASASLTDATGPWAPDAAPATHLGLSTLVGLLVLAGAGPRLRAPSAIVLVGSLAAALVWPDLAPSVVLAALAAAGPWAEHVTPRWAAAGAAAAGLLLASTLAFDRGAPPAEPMVGLRALASLPAARVYNAARWRGAAALAVPLAVPSSALPGASAARTFWGVAEPWPESGVPADAAHVEEARPGWQDLLGVYRVDAVLVPKDGPLASALGRESAYELVAEGPVEALYVRRGAPGRPAVREASPP